MKKLPIGLQVFKEYIEQGYLYIDKTKWVWQLVSQGKYYFFARPRRFGKSLVQSGYLHLRTALETENAPEFIKQLKGLFANIPSRLHMSVEAYYQSSIYLILSLLGVEMFLEKETNQGIIDGVIEYEDKVYIFEFKYAPNKRIKHIATLVKKALKQIKDRKYYEAYLGKQKKIILFGIGFLDKQIDGKVEVIE